MVENLLVGAVEFGRTCIGLVTRPYETYRRIIYHGSLWELPFIGILLAVYFSLASLIKAVAFRPFLLTREFVTLGVSAAATYVLMVGLVMAIGTRLGGKGELRNISLAWGYTLLPTVLWFLMTSILYVVLPPPRTTSPQGVAFSVVFLLISTVLLFWKAVLVYLTLRFGLRLDLKKILIVVGICLPVIVIYSVVMYRLGITRVPFI